MSETTGSGQSSYPPLVETLDLWRAQTVLADPEARTAYFNGLSYEQFHELVAEVNSLVQPGKPGGYIPTAWNNVQVEEQDDRDVLDAHVTYFSPSHEVGDAAQREAFVAAQEMGGGDAAIAMIAIVNIGVHRLHNGHTRTGVVGRQLLAPEGRGYRGTDEDREAYARLVTNRDQYMAQSLHPWRGKLVETYVRQTADAKTERLGYDGPPILGVERATPGDYFRQLPVLWWGETTKRLVSEIITERDFGLLAALEYADIMDEPVADFVSTETGVPRISLTALANSMRDVVEPDALEIALSARDAYKGHFLTAIVDCIARGDESVFGRPSLVLDQYRLPKL
jgi:hypothetical protein